MARPGPCTNQTQKSFRPRTRLQQESGHSLYKCEKESGLPQKRGSAHSKPQDQHLPSRKQARVMTPEHSAWILQGRNCTYLSPSSCHWDSESHEDSTSHLQIPVFAKQCHSDQEGLPSELWAVHWGPQPSAMPLVTEREMGTHGYVPFLSRSHSILDFPPTPVPPCCSMKIHCSLLTHVRQQGELDGSWFPGSGSGRHPL